MRDNRGEPFSASGDVSRQSEQFIAVDNRDFFSVQALQLCSYTYTKGCHGTSSLVNLYRSIPGTTAVSTSSHYAQSTFCCPAFQAKTHCQKRISGIALQVVMLGRSAKLGSRSPELYSRYKTMSSLTLVSRAGGDTRQLYSAHNACAQAIPGQPIALQSLARLTRVQAQSRDLMKLRYCTTAYATSQRHGVIVTRILRIADRPSVMAVLLTSGWL